jgi:uncharacterized membrane protein
LAKVVLVAVVATALVLRFWIRSDLWLDEALTVDIARQPLHDIPALLRRDGAPPLFYVLLHLWMRIFGTSDYAVRALPGVIGVVTLPLVWVAGRRLGGGTVAWGALVLLATSPFAVRYSTEVRMYSLVALLTVLGILALDRSLVRPRFGNLIAVAAVTGLLLYAHYWSVYLVGTVVLWLAYQAWRGRPAWRSGARASLVAVAVGCMTFLPWVPIALYQARHTGTPWATPSSFGAMVTALTSFTGGFSNEGWLLSIVCFALAGLGLFGAAVDRRHIDIDLLTRRPVRPLAIAIAGTLGAALIGGILSNSTVDARYASVVFVPVILVMAFGLSAFGDRRIQVAVLALAAAAGLIAAVPNIVTSRTQAGQVAAAIAAHGQAGDVIAYCPDQLGPAVNRLLPPGRYLQTTFPRGTGPEYVDWVDYATATHAGRPQAFAQHLENLAAPAGRQIFVVWAGGYQTFGGKCQSIVRSLENDTSYRSTSLVGANGVSFYQPMALTLLTPAGP